MRTWHWLATLALVVATAIALWILVGIGINHAHAAAPGTSYEACLLREARHGVYVSTDDGESVLVLMNRCGADRAAWVNRCVVMRGHPYADCMMLGAARAMLTIVVIEDMQQFTP